MNNEVTLIRNAQQGNSASFSELVIIYQKQISSYLVTKCYNSNDAEDIMQETFINAYKYIQSYNENWKFSTWLYTIAKRLIKKHNDYYNKHKDYSEPEAIAMIDENVPSKENIWYHIRLILNSFAFDVVWFHYVEEFKIREIAQILGSSQSKVKMSIFRSKRKLAKSKTIQSLFQEFVQLEMIL